MSYIVSIKTSRSARQLQAKLDARCQSRHCTVMYMYPARPPRSIRRSTAHHRDQDCPQPILASKKHLFPVLKRLKKETKLGSFGTFAIWQRVDSSPVTQKKTKRDHPRNEGPARHAAHHTADRRGSAPTVSYGLCSWYPWGWQASPAAEGGLV